MICPNCGFEIREGLTFCPKCGIELGEDNRNENAPIVEIDVEDSDLIQMQEMGSFSMGSNGRNDQNDFDYITPQTMKKKFYQKTWFIILMLIIFCPVGIPLMWKYTDWNKIVKIIISVIVGMLFVYGFFSQDSGSNLGANHEKDNYEHNCGDTVEFSDALITIDNPISSFTVKTEVSYVHQEHAYLRVPITIEAKKGIKIKAEDFNSKVVEEQNDCMPKQIELKEGEVYKGVLCKPWQPSNPADYSYASEYVQCDKNGFEGVWKFNYDKAEKSIISDEDVEGILPNIPVSATVTVEEINHTGAVTGNDNYRIITLKINDDFNLYTFISEGNVAQWEEYMDNGEELNIKGVVRNITRESGGAEPFIDKCIMISDVELE